MGEWEVMSNDPRISNNRFQIGVPRLLGVPKIPKTSPKAAIKIAHLPKCWAIANTFVLDGNKITLIVMSIFHYTLNANYHFIIVIW